MALTSQNLFFQTHSKTGVTPMPQIEAAGGRRLRLGKAKSQGVRLTRTKS